MERITERGVKNRLIPTDAGNNKAATENAGGADSDNSGDTALLYAMLEASFEFRRNALSCQIEYRPRSEDANAKWTEFTDTDANTIKVQAVRERGLPKARVGIIWEWANSLYVPSYHPVQDWLCSLEWDGRDHIAYLCSLVKTEDDDLWRRYVRAWLVRAVDQTLTGAANEYMLILSGKQGMGKTTFAQALVPPRLRRAHYRACKVDATNKDGLGLLAQSWIICDDELNGLRKQEVEAVKGMLSLSDIAYRPPYGRAIITRPRLASFVGGTNEDKFLTDPTGSRRFLAIEAHAIDHDALRQLDISGVWAQAMALYASGERGFLDAETRERQALLNEDKQEENVFSHYVAEYAAPSANNATWIATTEFAHFVAERLAERSVRVSVTNGFVKQLGSALKKAGYKQDRNGPLRWKIEVRHSRS